MGLKGAAIGGFAGWCFGGPLGSLFGSFLGSWVENHVNGEQRGSSQGSDPRIGNGLVFCSCAAAMLAKLAKADGAVSRGEIAAVEAAFARLGFSAPAREYAIGVFRKAKDDNHTIYEYARDFANSVPSVEVRELLYELLWDVGCADERISTIELSILRKLPSALGIRSAWFDVFARERIAGYGQSSRQWSASAQDSLASAYELLGASSSDDAATLKRKYRELAKKFHPDALRAQGLPDEMIGKANERMSKINAAWSEIKSARGL